MSRPQYIKGVYENVIYCAGPWDMQDDPEIHKHRHGHVVLTDSEWDRQMMNPEAFWKCPICGMGAYYDEDNFQAWCDNNPIEKEVDNALLPMCMEWGVNDARS